MKALDPCGMFKSTSLHPSPSEEFLKLRRSMQPSPQGVETLSNEETEEFTLASPPHKMATHAPPVYIIPNNDDD
jgi:hypothetical protein